MVKKPLRPEKAISTLKRKKKPPSWEYKPVENPTPPALRSRGPAPQYNWTLIRNEYVEGYLRDNPKDEFDRNFPTYEQLSQRHGASLSAIRQRGSTERWKNLKNQYAIELTQAKQKKRANKLANASVQFDDNALKVGELGITLVMSRLAEIGKEMPIRARLREQALQDMEAGREYDKADLRSAVYHAEMQTLANAAEKFQQIGMRALGTSADAVNNITNVQVGDTNIGNTVNVAQELVRDDTERMTALISGFIEAGSLSRDFVDGLGTKESSAQGKIIESHAVVTPADLEPDEETIAPTESVPKAADVDDDEYEEDPEIIALIDSMPKVRVTDLDPRMKQVSEDPQPAKYAGSDYDIDPALVQYEKLSGEGMED